MPPTRSSSPAGSRRRLTTRLHDMLVPSRHAGRKSGDGGRGAGSGDRRSRTGRAAENRRFVPSRTIVLVGLMGAGKSKIGRRLAVRLGLPFFDSDHRDRGRRRRDDRGDLSPIAAKRVFRDGERRVIARLLSQPVHVLATGGGAFMDPATRAVIARRGVSLWLRADLDVLVARVSRRNNRPLLQERRSAAILAELIERRHPVYAEAESSSTAARDRRNRRRCASSPRSRTARWCRARPTARPIRGPAGSPTGRETHDAAKSGRSHRATARRAGRAQLRHSDRSRI